MRRLGEHAESDAEMHQTKARAATDAAAAAGTAAADKRLEARAGERVRRLAQRAGDGELLQPCEVGLQQMVRVSDQSVVTLDGDDGEHGRLCA